MKKKTPSSWGHDIPFLYITVIYLQHGRSQHVGVVLLVLVQNVCLQQGFSMGLQFVFLLVSSLARSAPQRPRETASTTIRAPHVLAAPTRSPDPAPTLPSASTGSLGAADPPR